VARGLAVEHRWCDMAMRASPHHRSAVITIDEVRWAGLLGATTDPSSVVIEGLAVVGGSVAV
jgi:hypothetical protein